MAQKLPKYIWVKQEIDGKDTYLIACESPIDITEKGNVVTVGLYELKEIQKLGLRVTSEPFSKLVSKK